MAKGLIELYADTGWVAISSVDCVVQNQAESTMYLTVSATIPTVQELGFRLVPNQIEQFVVAAGSTLYADASSLTSGGVYFEEIA